MELSTGLVMVSGTGPGVGKTSLFAGLATVLSRGSVDFAVVQEDDVWGRRQLGDEPVDTKTAMVEFSHLLHSGRAATPEAVLATFDLVVGANEGRVLLQDWSWLDLAEMLPWSRSEDSFMRFAESLSIRADGLRPALLYLAVDPTVALNRAASDRGEIWLRRHALSLGLGDDRPDGAVADWYRQREKVSLRRVRASGWSPTVIDASGLQAEVLARAVRALGW